MSVGTQEKYHSQIDLARRNHELYFLFQELLTQIEETVNLTMPPDTENDFPIIYMGQADGWPAVEVAHVSERASLTPPTLPPKEPHFQAIMQDDLNLLNQIVEPWENYQLDPLWYLVIARAVTGIPLPDGQKPQSLTMLRQIYPSLQKQPTDQEQPERSQDTPPR